MQLNGEQRVKAYSYIRMSTQRQLSGDSLRRQLENTRKYAKDHNLILDETLRDIGVSAYSGANVQFGALGRFHELVKTGKIERGSYLIIESLDRLSRKSVIDALEPFLALLRAGIVIVTLGDDQVYSYESVGDNFSQLITSLVIMSRAHEESATKSQRIKSAIKKKRDDAMNGIGRYNFNLPTWIDVVQTPNGIEYKLNAHAETVRLIYELLAEGNGQNLTARILNDRKVPTFRKNTKRWNSSSINGLLHQVSVIGTFQNKTAVDRVYKNDGDPIPNFFPAAVGEDIYLQAQAKRKTRTNVSGRRGKLLTNLFQGKTTCAHCQGSMTVYYGGSTKNPILYLRCYNRLTTSKLLPDERATAREMRCVAGRGFRYDAIEKPILDNVREYKLSDLFTRRSTDEARQLGAIARDILALDDEIKKLSDLVRGYSDELVLAPAVLKPNMRVALMEHTTAQNEKAKQRERLIGERDAIVVARKMGTDVEQQIASERAAWGSMEPEELFRSRMKVHNALNQFIDYISFNAEERRFTVIIGGGYAAYEFDDKGNLTRQLNMARSPHMWMGPSPLTVEHFASSVPLKHVRDENNQPQLTQDTIEALDARYDTLAHVHQETRKRR